MILSRRHMIVSAVALAAASRHAWAAGSGSTVETAQGKVRGLVADNGVHVFKGMRYAASSAGALRFMPPTAPPAISS